MDDFHPFASVEKRMEICLLGKEEFLLPDSILEQSSIFRDVVSLDTWTDHLTDAQRKHLLRFLPSFPENDRAEKEATLNLLLTGETFKFGNPLKQFHTRLRDGYFSPDISKYAALCRKAKHREYKIQQQNYYSRLLREILLSRERVLDEVRQLPPDEHPKFCYVPPKTKRQTMEGKVTRKYVKLLKDVRAECGVEETSSEEEDLPIPVPRSKRQAAKALFPLPSPEPTVPNVLSTLDPKPQLNGDIKPFTPAEPEACEKADRPAVRQTPPPPPRVMRGLRHAEITEEQYRELLKKHKKRRLENSDSPDLDTKNLTLQDIISRCQALPKKPPSRASPATQAANAKRRFRIRPRPMKKLLAHKRSADDMPEIQTDVVREAPEGCMMDEEEADIGENLMNVAEDENLPELMVDSERALTIASGGQYDSFFSMLRDFIVEFQEAKVTTPKLEEKVRDWQDSDIAVMNAWFPAQNSWLDTVISALKFLSGDALGLDLDNFIPFLDYKERAQQWKWIGAGRDTDEELLPLYRHWLHNKEDTVSDLFSDRDVSPPPPRIRTGFVVRATSDREKEDFREQEQRRFMNPHRAFTYCLHNYESVVGPVKGVYNKECAVNKAREHALLISDRQAYVTILTLVRDSAARLPNGEGTRGDICELLKDSCFLAPGVTDSQINTVVSGALDRLHYEKDPCVKYDGNRKLWIYLHRNRVENEFERLHKAQGAAAKAKKSLQRPKLIKKPKEMISGIVSSVSTTSIPDAAASQHETGGGLIPLPSAASVSAILSQAKTIKLSLASPAAQSTSASNVSGNTALQTPMAGIGLVGSVMPSSDDKATQMFQTLSNMSVPLTTMTSAESPISLLASASVSALGNLSKADLLVTSGNSNVISSMASAAVRQPMQASSALSLTSSGGGGQSPRTRSTSRTTHAGSPRMTAAGGMMKGSSTIRQTLNALQNAQLAAAAAQATAAQQQGKLQTPTGVSTTTMLSITPPNVSVSQAQATLGGKPVTISFIPSQTGTGTVPMVTHMKSAASGGKPLSFSILQGQGIQTAKLTATAIANSSMQPIPQAGTLVLTSKPEAVPKGMRKVSTPSTPVTIIDGSGKTVQSLIATTNIQDTTNLGLGQGHGQPISKPTTSTVTVTTPAGQMVARLVQQIAGAPQVMSVGNLLSGAVHKVAASQQGGTTLKIQGGNIVHPVSAKPIQLTGKPLAAAKGLLQLANTGAATVSGMMGKQVTPPLSLIRTPLTAGSTAAAVAVVSLSATQTSTQKAIASSAPASHGLQNVPQAKIFNPGGMQLPAQFIVQQAPGPVNAGGDTATPVSVAQASMATPILMSSPGGKPGQNIQLVRTMLSQQALKPGQATILISQPSIPHSSASILTTSQPPPGGGRGTKITHRGKPQTMYARIIAPPAGLRLANLTAAQQSQIQQLHGQGQIVTMAQAQAQILNPGQGQTQIIVPSHGQVLTMAQSHSQVVTPTQGQSQPLMAVQVQSQVMASSPRHDLSQTMTQSQDLTQSLEQTEGVTQTSSQGEQTETTPAIQSSLGK